MPVRPIDSILNEVRAFYAAGKKSGNKVYTSANFVSDADWAAHSRQWSVRIMAGNLFRNRNKNQAISDAHRPAWPAGMTRLAWAQGIYNGGARAEFTSGNCAEMASVAAMLAFQPQYGYQRAWSRVATVGAPGDHAFCILSMTVPRWARPSAMIGAAGASGAYVIDPWMNIACSAEEYWGLVLLKVQKWAREGKRIWWHGPQGRGWYIPTGPYALAFANAPITYEAM